MESDATRVMRELIRIRKKLMTASEVAKRMGVSKQQIWNIETGYQGHPSILTVERYAKAIKAKIKIIAP